MDWVTKLNWAKEDAEQIGIQKGVEKGIKTGIKTGIKKGINQANNNNAIAVARQLRLLGMPEKQIQQNLQAIFGSAINPCEILEKLTTTGKED